MIAVKACACGKLYTLEAWLTLPFAGRDPSVPAVMYDRRYTVGIVIETAFELRNCPCGSTMALEIERGGLAPYSDSEIAEREARDTIVDEIEVGAA